MRASPFGGLLGAALGLALAAPAAGQDGGSIADRFDLEHPVARHDLPGRLREISGLTFGPGGQLFAHQDERAIVYRIDPESGRVDHGFTLGEKGEPGDFEAIAAVGDRLFLATSRGKLFEFRAVAEGEVTPFRASDVGLGGTCEVEGLAYLAAADQLLFACKTVRPEAPEVRIHRIPLAPDAPAAPPIRVPFARFEEWGLEDGVHPSAIDVDPVTGHLVLLAAREEAMFEIDVDGRLVWAKRLGRSRHRQPEGIAFGPDGRLYVSDEANGRGARLTVYGPRRAGDS